MSDLEEDWIIYGRDLLFEEFAALYDRAVPAWANLLFSKDDRPGSYIESKGAREPIMVRFGTRPEGFKNIQFKIEVLTSVDWPSWEGAKGYILFGIWLGQTGGEPLVTWVGSDSLSKQPILPGSFVSLCAVSSPTGEAHNA